MVDYNNPVIIAEEFMKITNFWHLVDGIFIWEFFTTLGFEWDVIRGHRPYRWTILVYSITRVATLLSIVLNIVGSDSTTRLYCQVWMTFIAFFTYTAFASASLLIALRIIAVWNMAKIPLVITMGVWVADVGFLISGTIRIRSAWSHEANFCVPLNLASTKPAVISSLVTDVLLLLIMIGGVFRLRLEAAGAFDLGYILWKQGLIWLFLATVSEVPPSVLMCLNLNEPMSLLFQTPSMVIMSIAATRMYRSLIDYANSRNDNGYTLSELRVRSGTVPPSRMEVSLRMEDDRYPTTQTSGISYTNTDPHGQYKMHEVSLNVDVERGSEK